MSDNRPIPLYTKIGGRITIILLLLLSFMLLKNCIGSIRYGTTTSQEEINQYYNKGFLDGSIQDDDEGIEEVTNENPLLKKAYRRGFRVGWDTRQRGAAVNNIETRDR